MNRTLRLAAPMALAMSLSACLGGLLGGGAKTPPWLLTLTPQTPAPESISRTAGAGEAVTIEVPVIPKEVRTTRVPVHSGPIAIANGSGQGSILVRIPKGTKPGDHLLAVALEGVIDGEPRTDRR